MSDHGVTKTLADFCANFRYENLPREAVNECMRIILDTVGCGLGGYGVEKGRIGAEFARRTGGEAEASIIGTKGKVTATMAAFANGELMNALDWCPVQPPAHVPPFVLPPVLAVAEMRRKSGKDLIAALALALEVTGRLANATGGLRSQAGGIPRRVWGLTSNQIGGTAGAGNLMGLDAEKMLHALGASGYYAPLATHVKFQYTLQQGHAKYGPSGWMAQGALTTALLAEIGYHGDTTFLEGEHGYYVQNGADAWNPDKLTGGLGQDWVFMSVGYKPWPTCGMFQSSLNVFDKLIRDHDFKPDEMEEVEINVEPMGTLPCYVSTEPTDHVDAASSAPYAVAVMAYRTRRGPGWQAQSLIDDPKIRAFMKKVRVGVNPKCEELRHRDIAVEGRSYPRHRPGHVIVRARGQVYEGSSDFCDWFSIDPDYRASDSDLADKFRDNAEIVLSRGNTDKAIDMILNLDRLDDVSPLLDTLAD